MVGIGTATWTSDWGYPQWHLVLCLAIAWTFAFFCVFRGVKSIGKVVYFTATFPYVILTALLIRALTMEGSTNGILYFISPQWEPLRSPGVWADATSQVFFSFGIAWGTLIVLSSFNKVIFAKIFEVLLTKCLLPQPSSTTIVTLMQLPSRSLTLAQLFIMES